MTKRIVKPESVRIRVRIPFSGMYEGDEAAVELTEVTQGWVNLGYVEVIEGAGYGEGAFGQSSPKPDVPGSSSQEA